MFTYAVPCTRTILRGVDDGVLLSCTCTYLRMHASFESIARQSVAAFRQLQADSLSRASDSMSALCAFTKGDNCSLISPHLNAPR